MGNDLSSSLEALFSRMENFITTKTVVGQPTEIGGVIIVPLVDVVFGVGAGNGEKEKGEGGGGMGGLGAKLTPSAVLVIQKDGTTQLVNVKNQDSLGKLIDMAPGVFSKLNLNSLFGKNKNDAAETVCKEKKPPAEEVVEEIHITETFEETV